jgi:hypothetical protein
MFNNQEDTSTIMCQHVGGTEDCSLVQKLRELQLTKKDVDNQIATYEKCDKSVAPKTIDLIVALHEDSCALPYWNPHSYYSYTEKVRSHFDYYGSKVLEWPLSKFTIDDIEEMCNELKLVKRRTEILEEKRELSKKLTEQIKEIKDTLGIE